MSLMFFTKHNYSKGFIKGNKRYNVIENRKVDFYSVASSDKLAYINNRSITWTWPATDIFR